MTGNERLVGAEHSLMLGPVAMARALGVSYDTYKNWKSDRTSMPAVATRCLDLLIDNPDQARWLGDRAKVEKEERDAAEAEKAAHAKVMDPRFLPGRQLIKIGRPAITKK